MKTTAKKLRAMVMENALELGRLTKEQLKEDYVILTELYQNALDSITNWASKDYTHKSTKEDEDNAFAQVKAVLGLFATDKDRIIIDKTSMRTIRDLSTKPKRMYSDEYKKAEKVRKEQAKTVDSRYEDLLTLGCSARNEGESVEDYVAKIREEGTAVLVGKIDMLDMYEKAEATLVIKTKKVDKIKANGKWTWKRVVSVSLAEFADLLENYIADCLTDNYNLKPSKQVRDEAKAERDAKRAKAE